MNSQVGVLIISSAFKHKQLLANYCHIVGCKIDPGP